MTPTGLEEYATPPSGFNPLTASDAELASLNIPVRPAGGTALSAWTDAMSAWRFTPAMSSLPVANPGAGSVAALAYTSDNWAGTMLDTQQAGSDEYSGVSGNYTEPNVTLVPNCNENLEAETPWLGIGGITNTNGFALAQVRTNSYMPATQAVGTGEAWWEYYPYNFQQSLNFAVNPGDHIYVSVGFSSAAAILCHDAGYSYGFNAFVEDTTTGTSNGVTNCTNNAPNGDTAEWIDERPGIGCTNPQNCTTAFLPDFHQTGFSSMEAVDQKLRDTYGPSDLFGQLFLGEITMQNGDDELAYPTSPSNNSAEDIWVNCS